MLIVGIDPGLTRCGYGALESRAARRRPARVALGVVRTPPSDPLPQRLAELQRELAVAPRRAPPGRAWRSSGCFFQVNVRTAMCVGQASGLAMAEAAAAGCEVAQYSPNEVKQAVAGWGGADKEQVQRMVQTLLGLAAPPQPGRRRRRRRAGPVPPGHGADAAGASRRRPAGAGAGAVR